MGSVVACVVGCVVECVVVEVAEEAVMRWWLTSNMVVN